MTKKNQKLYRLGFRFERGSAHSSRTMMVEELTKLLACVTSPDANKSDYLRAIEDENCLGKRSGKTRTLTHRHLVDLYSLDPVKVVFRALLYFWNRDIDGQPLLALLCAYARDSILRATAPLILNIPDGAIVPRESVEEFIDRQEPGRFSKATLKSTAQNVNSTWTKSGHLHGRARKVRSRAKATTGSVSYALLLGYLTGERGPSLFQTEYFKLLDCSIDTGIELAQEASRRGWIVFKRIGDVIEVLFPNQINQKEMELLREQG